MRAKAATVIIVFALLAALSVTEQIAVRRMTDDALGQTAQILSDISAGDMDAAIKKAHALDQAWDKNAKLLEMLVDHGSTDDVRYALSRLIAALEGENHASAMIYAGELEGSVEYVFERQAVSLENLL